MGACASAASDGKKKPKLQGKDRYKLGEELGKGHFAEVRTCIDQETGGKLAIKIIDKKDLIKSEAVVKEEIAILRQVGQHKHVVALLDNFEDEKQFYLVMEMCDGGDLFSKIVQEGKYSEQRAIKCCKQLAQALQWIHKRGVTHRDLKPENILLTSDNIDADIKVADFGLSKLMKNQADVMRTVCGTWAYCAPEVIARKPYTQAVDNWTLGVLMFILLSGYHPFDVYGELPEPQLLRKIMDCSYDFDDEVWTHVSEEAKNLIRGLLKLEPRDRISLDTFLSSPWITKADVAKDRELPLVITRLEKLNKGRRKFRALVLAKLASRKFKKNLDRSRSKNPSSQSISLGSYPHGGFIDAESARSDRSEVVSHRTYDVKYFGAPVPGASGTAAAGTASPSPVPTAGQRYSPNGHAHAPTFSLAAPTVLSPPPALAMQLTPLGGPALPAGVGAAPGPTTGGNTVTHVSAGHSTHSVSANAVGLQPAAGSPMPGAGTTAPNTNGFMADQPQSGSVTASSGSLLGSPVALRPHTSKERAAMGGVMQSTALDASTAGQLIAPPVALGGSAPAPAAGSGGGQPMLLAPPGVQLGGLPGAATHTPPAAPTVLSSPAALLTPPAGLALPSTPSPAPTGSGDTTPNAQSIGANGLLSSSPATAANGSTAAPGAAATLQPPANVTH